MPAQESRSRSKAGAVLGSLVFFVLAPGTFAGWVPWRITRWRLGPPLLGWSGFRLLGVILIVTGLAGLIDCFARFALQGRGTPAPPVPTERLVVSGLYRYVRNPMYLSVIATVVGQALLFGSTALLYYVLVVWLGFHVFIRAYEEPALRARYGAQYDAYCAAVRRWVPRPRPYTPTRPA